MTKAQFDNTTATRRGFLTVAAGAGAAAVALPPTAANALVLDATKASPALRELISALHDAHDLLTERRVAFDAIYEQYRAWSKTNHEPRTSRRRAFIKWDKRYDKFMDSIGFYKAQDAQQDASDAHRAARLAVAEFKSRDLIDVTTKAAAALVFEGDSKTYRGSIISQGVTLDMLRIAMRT